MGCMSLIDVHRALEEVDGVRHVKEAAEMEKFGEEDAAGRIMARGFMDELEKKAGLYLKPSLKSLLAAGLLGGGLLSLMGRDRRRAAKQVGPMPRVGKEPNPVLAER
jgi:hypothetical protein